MERRVQAPAEDRTPTGRGLANGWWLLVGVSLVVWQSWLTLGLFGGLEPWRNLVDDRPILSGAHPQHLYLGALGSKAWRVSGHGCCYDTAFQGAYLKTPVFNGSRFAELFLFLAGGGVQAAVYKVGLAAMCLLVPLLLLLAGRAVGLGPLAAGLATAVGLLIWWGPAGRQTMEMGESEFLLAALAVLAHVALLVRFHHAPGALVWLGLVATAWLSWFAHPLIFPVLLFLLLAYYLTVGVRHASLTWHLALWGGQLLALAVNAFWLIDWVGYWWLRLPLPQPPALLPHFTWQALWQAPLWGGATERILALVLLGSALVGVAGWNRGPQRVAARLFGLGAGSCLVLALLGITWEPLGQLGASALLAPALWFAALPAVHGWTLLFRLLGHWTGAAWRGHLLGLGTLAALAAFGPGPIIELAGWAQKTTPLVLGLGVKREALVQELARQTGPEARILWEDRQLPRTAPRWSALLPHLTGRSFLGGLDADGAIEHSAIGLIDQSLAGRPISTWSDAALEDYCRRYNIGWIVAWTPGTANRLRCWSAAELTVPLTDDAPGWLFTIQRSHSYFLKGQGRLIHADSHHVTLADVKPVNGQVVLSFHYQSGLRATPTRGQVEREPDVFDPVGFVRLRVASPVARVTLTWERR